MFDNYIGWHIELTRRCPLQCPACERTIRADQIPDLKLDIDADLLIDFFEKERNSEIRYMFLQGNLGDPIYHPDFHRIAEHFFNCELLAVTTNGMQNIEFWKRILDTWPENALVELSIDGLRDTNSVYRVNSNWDKMQDLFDLISSTTRKCRIQWKYIVFEHNHHQIDEARQLSRKLGMDSFRIQKSRRFAHNHIKPYHDDRYFQPDVEFSDDIDPFCLSGDMHYITAGGDYYPCCWWADQNKQVGLWEPMNISNYTMGDLKTAFRKFASCYLQSYDGAPTVCKDFCKKKMTNAGVPNTQLYRTILRNDT